MAPIPTGMNRWFAHWFFPLLWLQLVTASRAQTNHLFADADPYAPEFKLPAIEKEFDAGHYDEARGRIRVAMRVGWRSVDYYRAWVQAEAMVGNYTGAVAAAETMLERHPRNLESMTSAYTWNDFVGNQTRAAELQRQINEAAKSIDPEKCSARDLLALGQAARRMGADAKLVLDRFFQPARKQDATLLDTHLAAADLALEKQDYALAAQILGVARKRCGDQTEIFYRLARAYFPSERPKAIHYSNQALAVNSNHVDTLLLLAEHGMDSEEIDKANQLFDRVRVVNPRHPKLLCLQAAQAWLDNDRKQAKALRAQLETVSPRQPQYDVLIGRKISQKRRFAEGLAFQEKALVVDPNYLPAQTQRGLNLLRLGREEEAWPILEAVHDRDPYNVEAYNLMLLHDHLQSFETIETKHFLIRMTPEEAAVYGGRVAELLETGYERFAQQYGFETERRILIEFFPQQQDFAIRTLGIPGGLGLLGACFGNVVTMNSPGSLGALDSNWESTLWHELAHVVTINQTRARIPRWLTEGISVYEEGQRDPVCRRGLTPVYRRQIAGEGLIPLERLSNALTSFSNPGLIDFAYFQSGQLVEFLLEHYGHESLMSVLDAISQDVAPEDALTGEYGAHDELWEHFTAYIEERATNFAPRVDWWMPPPDSPLRTDPGAVAELLDVRPSNHWALVRHGLHLQRKKNWQELKAVAERLCELLPEDAGEQSAWLFLARAHRELGNAGAEQAALQEFSRLSPGGAARRGRLIELNLASEDWESAADHARRLQAINPMLRVCQRGLGVAFQALGRREPAIAAFERLLHLKPADPADVRFRLAQLEAEENPEAARRHLLRALEDAPRFRAAHRLLLKLTSE